MTGADRGFLLLTGHLGDPERNPLTVAQFRELTRLARRMELPLADRELREDDLISLGCGREFSRRVLRLLSQEDQLDWYLERGQRQDCFPITRVNPLYPQRVRQRLDTEAPGSLWAKGDLSVLQQPMIALVGSRDLTGENLAFAREVGRHAALQGYALVSGNARGADKAAQESCLEQGGSVICVVADELETKPVQEKLLYLSEEGFDLPFSAQRALSRNRIIHTLAPKVFVAQCTLGHGGTWDGTTRNLRSLWSQVYCFADGSAACTELVQLGATAVTTEELRDISALKTDLIDLF